MIFITLGTQDKPFNRLLEKVEKQIELGNIKDKVIVQSGYTKYTSEKMEIHDLLDMDEFSKYIKDCDLLITHGGVGSIIDGLKNGKVVIAAPRLSKYKEHVNDHQKQIIENFDKEGYIIGLNDELDNFADALKKAKTFKPNKFKSNTENMIELVKGKIKELVGE